MTHDLKSYADYCILHQQTPNGKSCVAVHNQFASCVTNIHKKKLRGVYDHEKAIKLYEYPVAAIAKLYEADLGGHASKATRTVVAKMFHDEFHNATSGY